MKSFLATNIIRLFGILPMGLAQWMGVLVGRCLYWLPNKTKQQTQLNIQRCLPQLTPTQQKLVTKQSLAHTAMAMMEMGHNWCRKPAANLARIQNITGQQLLTEAKPRIVLTPHFGNWELFATWLANQVPLTALYKPAKLDALDKLIADGRNSSGMALAPASAKGVLALKRALNKQQAILILPDQEPPAKSAIKVSFFGQPAYTMTLAGQLAKSTDVQILLGWAQRLGPNNGFNLELLDITDQCKKDSLEDTVQAMNDAIANLIRQHPAQYQWEYRRFKQTLEQG